MNTPFERLPPDIVREWVENPVTLAYFATLRNYRGQLAAALVTLAGEGLSNPSHAILSGGQVRGLDFAIALPGKADHG